ncbi:protein Jade-1 isoform X2 [Salvelinus fontinalis]|uniref:protein Jade-1 isoform X2 n=1 Tax=Salvelinus fontinalis TaxID=8038 RepID=UPI0024867BED|nr:protein Jade-1 isoform X2 [Salvelinus fontinalis]
MKRSRHPSSSEDSDNGSNSTSWSQHSQLRRANGMKPAEVFRTDFITAMKLHDTYHLNPEDYYVLADPWRHEWEKGVQVPVSPHIIPQTVARVVAEKGTEVMFLKPKKWIRSGGSEALGYVDIQTLAEGTCQYDLNDTDVAWLELINHQFTLMGMAVLDETTMERAMEEFERRSCDRMRHPMATEEGFGMEYDEDVVCDVCRSPDGEDNNEMVFCDKCNICVHQACYGILKVPKGSWLCRTCALGISPKCQVCRKKGRAMKPTRSGTKWFHVSCALWIPECSAKSCQTAFHVSCALDSSLEMNTIKEQVKSFCPKHSGLVGGEEGTRGGRDEVPNPPAPHPVPNPVEDLNLRHIRLQQLEESHQLVDVKEVSRALQLNQETVHFMYRYWKLKCQAKQPLLTPQMEEESVARTEHDIVLRHQGMGRGAPPRPGVAGYWLTVSSCRGGEPPEGGD